MKPRLHTIICSTRPGRVGPAPAKWIHQQAIANGKFECHLIDLAEFKLPIFDEPQHPRLRTYQHDHTRSWSASVQAADAYVFVTPEYNHGPPPALLNAMNFVYAEWNYKPATFVSYGGPSGGARAVQAERLTLAALKVVPILETVAIPMIAEHLTATGEFAPTELHSRSASAALNELFRWAMALRQLRTAP